jgi:Beta-propeller repeat
VCEGRGAESSGKPFLLSLTGVPEIERSDPTMKTPLRAIVSSWVLLSPALLVAAPNSDAPTSILFDRPLVFEPNLGQSPSQVFWTARGQGYQLYLTGSGASIVLAEPVPASAADSSINAKPGGRPQGLPKARMSIVGMNLGGSHAWNAVEGLEPTGGVSNYLVGPQKDWHKGIPQYGRVRVKDVYDGIDLVFYGHGHEMEYDFVVRPGGDPNQIRLAFDGVQSMQVDAKNGDLVIKTKTGSEMRHVQPKVYQQVGDKKVEVAGGYQIMDDGQAAFRLAQYDRRKALVVDPTVEFTTFFEGNAQDSAYGVAVDATNGNSYVTGQTFSTDFPVTTAAPVAKNCPGNVCPAYIFVTELSPQGTVLQSTLIGGSDTDYVGGIAVDQTGVWVSGMTNSQNFSTHTQFGHGFWNGFVAKLTPDLSQLDWCVTFGGVGDQTIFQGANAIAVDSNHAAYVTGLTGSVDFPTSLYTSTTLQPKQQAFGGGVYDAFVVKVGADGYLNSGYSTYLGGSGFDEAFGIAVDNVGHAYVTGQTNSSDFPVNGAPSHGAPNQDGSVAFITELSKDGSKSLYSVLLGGTKTFQGSYPVDGGNAIAVDATGVAYVTGFACSSDFPTTAQSFQPSPPSACLPNPAADAYQSAFVAKLSNTGTLLYSTYFGGAGGASFGYGIGFDPSGNTFVAGSTTTGLFPGVLATTTVKPSAGFLSKLGPKLEKLSYTTFLGADIYALAIYEPPTDNGLSGLPGTRIFTAGDRYVPNSDTTQPSNLDAFVVRLIDTP